MTAEGVMVDLALVEVEVLAAATVTATRHGDFPSGRWLGETTVSL